MTTCTYIGGGEGCTQAALEGRHYCAEHYALVYKVGSGVQRRKDSAQAARVRLVQEMMQSAIEQLEAEGFDLYGDTAVALDITDDILDE
jgi:hypothetical protein